MNQCDQCDRMYSAEVNDYCPRCGYEDCPYCDVTLDNREGDITDLKFHIMRNHR